jgi:hypothetical protein
MKSFKEYLIESGGKLILGANPLQLDTSRKLIRHLKRFSDHINVEASQNHQKIFDRKTGALLHTFTSSGSIGPKAAIHILSTVRQHLESIGAIEKNTRETRGLSGLRKNRVVDVQIKTPSKRTPEENAERLQRLKGIVRARLGQRRSDRIERAIQRLERSSG